MLATTHADVTVVYVTYQSLAIVDQLAHAINRARNVIVVDNASSDGTLEKLREKCQRAQFIESQINLGFGCANNLALANVKTKFALLVNPDCTYTEESLSRMLETFDQYPGAALIAPQAIGPGGPQVSYRAAYFAKLRPSKYIVPDGVTSAQFLSGCCMLLRLEAFEDDYFDPRFFLYFEDDDICLRAIRRGYECLLQPSATVYHELGQTSTPTFKTLDIKAYHYARSKRLLTYIHQGRLADLRVQLNYLLVSPWMIVLFFILLRKKEIFKWWGRLQAGFAIFDARNVSND
ncbi:MAG: hypothetical protein RL211_697 [Pseudomonadota bacterium]|jgi:GT2 family glycosyltransferase